MIHSETNNAFPVPGIYFHNMEVSRYIASKEVQRFSTIEMLSKCTPKGSCFVTLTFYNHMKDDAANDVLRKFRNRLSEEVYSSSRSTRRNNPAKISFISVKEWGKNQKLHFHLILHPIKHEQDLSCDHEVLTTPEGMKLLDTLVRKSWTSLNKRSYQTDLREIHSKEGLAWYLTKEIYENSTEPSYEHSAIRLTNKQRKEIDKTFNQWIRTGFKSKLN